MRYNVLTKTLALCSALCLCLAGCQKDAAPQNGTGGEVAGDGQTTLTVGASPSPQAEIL